LRAGELAKLIFYIKERDGSLSGERMWVEITGVLGPYYLGELRNIPLADQPGRVHRLKWGSPIVFLPEHVIDIVKKRRPRAKRKKART
jgi:hypothetical protein